MRWIWSSFDDLPGWKRRFLLWAFLVSIAGMIWETNDLVEEHREHPFFSAKSRLQGVSAGYDEYGDPYALSKPERHRSLPYARIWSSPLTRAAFSFFLALLAASLFRGLLRGAVTLLALLFLAGWLTGRESFVAIFSEYDGVNLAKSAQIWIADRADLIKDFLWDSLPSAGAAAVGFVMGLLK